MATHRISYATELGWANGEAPSKMAGTPATQDPASVGIDNFRNIGELCTGFSSTEVGTATVSDNITIMKVMSVWDGTTITREVFGYGSAGRLYRITDATTPVVTLCDGAAKTNNVDGLEAFGTYIYYAQQTQIGRFGPLNAVSPSGTDNYLTGLTATVNGQTITHPLLKFKGDLLVGDGNKIKAAPVGASPLVTRLQLTTGYVVTALKDYGNFVLIGAGPETVVDTQTKVVASLFLWNTTVSGTTESSVTAPTQEIVFPEPYIHNIQVMNDEVYVFGLNYLYKLSGSAFKIVTKLDCRVGPGGADVNRGQLWFKGSDDIRAIGTPDPQLPVSRYRPYGGTGTSLTAIKWVQDAKLLVADNNNLNEFKAGSQTTKTWKSRMISFSKQEMIEEVRVYLGANLASGDDVRIQLADEVGNLTTIATFDFATYGAVNELTLKAHQLTNPIAHRSAMQICVLFQAGVVRVREVVVTTKPVAQP